MFSVGFTQPRDKTTIKTKREPTSLKGGLVVFYALFRCRLARLQSGEWFLPYWTTLTCKRPVTLLTGSLHVRATVFVDICVSA
jgi:hypothetical protein